MAFMLPKFSDEDFEVTYSRKRKISNSSTTSSDSSTSSSTSSSNSSGYSKRSDTSTPAPDADFLLKRRTAPSKFCPKAKPPTMRFQPTNIIESKAPKIPHVSRPLQHIHKRQLLGSSSNENMQSYRAFRELEKQKAQEAKLNGESEEPPRKKRAQKRRN